MQQSRCYPSECCHVVLEGSPNVVTSSPLFPLISDAALPPVLLIYNNSPARICTAENAKMSSTPFIKELLSIAIQLAESLSARIPKSEALQRSFKQTAANLSTWRKNFPSEMEFLLKPTGDKALYRAILSPLSELLCIMCMSVHLLSHRH